MLRFIALAVVFCGCSQTNEQSCELAANKDKPECGGTDGGGTACDDTHPCADGVCKTPPGVCVECLANTDCMDPANPTCDPATNTCNPCVQHGDCDSNACLPSGQCADESTVAYAEAGKTGADCTRLDPCATLAEAIAKDRPTIKVNKGTGPVSDTVTNTITGRAVTILADPGAAIASTTSGNILEIKNDNADVTIVGLEIVGKLANADGFVLTGGTGTTAAKLDLERVIVRGLGGRGVVASTTGRLTMRKCVVASNIGGGANLQTVVFDLTNNIFVLNGNVSDTSGGLIVSPRAGSVFEFNTIASNDSLAGSVSGVNCVSSIPGANSNIVVDNTLGLQCTDFDYSLFDMAPVMGGTHNVVGLAKFRNQTPADFRKDDFFRIAGDSDAVDVADPASSVADDIDGELRPKGNGKDIGADEAN